MSEKAFVRVKEELWIKTELRLPPHLDPDVLATATKQESPRITATLRLFSGEDYLPEDAPSRHRASKFTHNALCEGTSAGLCTSLNTAPSLSAAGKSPTFRNGIYFMFQHAGALKSLTVWDRSD